MAPFWTGFKQAAEYLDGVDPAPVPPPATDGYFTSDAGTYNAELGRWEVPPGTTFTVIEPGKLETDSYGGIGSLVAIMSSSGGVGSNYGDFPWVGTFSFATTGLVAGNDNGSVNNLERYYSGSDGAWVGGTVDLAPGYPSDLVMYVSLFLNAQS